MEGIEDERWDVLNIERREQCVRGGEGLLGDISVFAHNLDLFDTDIRIPCLPREAEEWLAKGPTVRQPGPFGKMSKELTDMIFMHVFQQEYFGAAVLSITCKLLFQVGKRYVVEDLVRVHARWAYCRIICLGSSTIKGDALPAGMLTDAEKHEVETTYIKGIDRHPSDDRTRCFSTFASTTYKWFWDVFEDFYSSMEKRSREIYYRPHDHSTDPGDSVALRDREMFDVLVCTRHRKLSYPEGPMVLYNLSKGEYVRENALTALALEYRDPGNPKSGPFYMDLGHVVLFRICWSADPSTCIVCAKKYKRTLTMGPWAGDRFCVTKEDKKPKLPKGMEWRDVTEEVDLLLRHLWETHVMHETLETSDEEETDSDYEPETTDDEDTDDDYEDTDEDEVDEEMEDEEMEDEEMKDDEMDDEEMDDWEMDDEEEDGGEDLAREVQLLSLRKGR